jgi:hypothetical protein
MAKYHINPQTGNPGACRAKEKCPFGDTDHHYDSKEAARQAFEASNQSFPKVIKAKFYRSGELTKRPAPFDDLKVTQEVFDKFKPKGIVGRSDGLFATTEVSDMARWVKGNSHSNAPYTPHEIIYHGPEPSVYSIHAYEQAGARISNYTSQPDNPMAEEKARQAVEEYWSSAIPLTEFLENREAILGDENYNHRDSGYEILFDPQYIEKARKVSWDLLIKSTDNEGDRSEFKKLKKHQKFV